VCGQSAIHAALSAALALTSVTAFAADYPPPKQGEWIARDFKFHSGETLSDLRLHYTTIGEPTGQPVLVLHGSGGSAASVSANLTALGVGQEGLASIRRPSTWNSIVGMRATAGVVSRTGSYSGWHGASDHDREAAPGARRRETSSPDRHYLWWLLRGRSAQSLTRRGP
jgi:hypothetical protein